MHQPDHILHIYDDVAFDSPAETESRDFGGGIEWHRFRASGIVKADGAAAGLCINWLVLPPAALYPWPVFFRGPDPGVPEPDSQLKHAIANAYWQTRWAEGGIRSTRGEVEPVGFIMVDRSAAFPERQADSSFSKTGPGRHVVQESGTGTQQLVLAAKEGRLRQQPDGAIHDIKTGSRIDSAFGDIYIGANATVPRPTTLRRLVPVSGSHRISDLFAAANPGSWTHPRHPVYDVLAAVNGGYFLNFPEEYSNRWCAMNDPTGLVVQAGRIRQLPLVPRAALLVDDSGSASLRTTSLADIRLRLPWEHAWREDDAPDGFMLDDSTHAGTALVVFTPAFHAESSASPPRTPAAAAVDLVVVFGEVTEVLAGGGAEIPANGLVISLPLTQLDEQAVLEKLRTAGRAVQFQLRHPDGAAAGHIVSGIGAGPMLLRDGTQLPDDFFSGRRDELFVPLLKHGSKTAVKGVAPTRFPCDVTRTRAPRTFAGLRDDGFLVLGVIDGRNVAHSVGATLAESARIAEALGCRDAMNLDGGGSSTMMLTAGSPAGVSVQAPAGIVNLPADNGGLDRLMPVPLAVTRLS